MENQVDDNKFTWVIKNFSSLQSEFIYSNHFVIDACKWRLMALPKGNKLDCLSIYLAVADYRSLPCGWRRQTKFRLSIVNQRLKRLSQVKERHKLFDQKTPASGFISMFPLGHEEVYGGFLVNDEIKIVAEVDVFEVIGESDVSSEEYDEEETQYLASIKDEHASVSSDLLNKAPPLDESINVDLVRRVFERHPDIVIGINFKNQQMKTACMSYFLSLIETLCQSIQDLFNEDMIEADNALTFIKVSGFDVDWLEKKLEQVKEKKKEEKIGETRIRELEEELRFLKQKCLEMEALLEEEKANVLAARAPLTLDEVIGKFDISEESQDATIQPPLKKRKRTDDDNALFIDLNADISSVDEGMDDNEFQLLPSHQVDFVKSIFEKHSDIVCPKNPYLKKAYTSLLISLMETLCQSPQKLSREDLVGADYAITCVKDLCFKVDWLEKTVEEVKQKKKQVESGESQMQELEKELKEFNQRFSDIEALLEKEKAKVFAARVPLTLDDVFLMT